MPNGETNSESIGDCSGRKVTRVAIVADQVAGASFSPRTVDIQAGDVVRFDWQTADCYMAPWSTTVGFVGSYLELSFDTPGYYPFACGTVPGVDGVVHVH
jgi:plastocyanin